MGIEIIILILAWFIAGAIIAVWMYLDMKANKRFESLWLLVGLLLSVIGLGVYLARIKMKRRYPYQYPPRPEYENPQYKFKDHYYQREWKEEREEVEEEPKTDLEQIEGIPRCPHCGAAISSHNWECPHCKKKIKE